VLVNGFAANDPESTGRIWRLAVERYGSAQRRIAIVNCRADRPDRSRQFAEAIATWPAADCYLLVGTGARAFARSAIDRGLAPARLATAAGRSIEEIVEMIAHRAGDSALVVGMANIGGVGFADRGVPFAPQELRRSA
jgi:hypothetical protein